MSQLDRLNDEIDEALRGLADLEAELASVTSGGVCDPGHYSDVLEALDHQSEYYESLMRELIALNSDLAGRG